MNQKVGPSNTTSELGEIPQGCENYHLYMVTLKPNFRSYVKKSIGDNNFMSNVFQIFMTHFCPQFRFIDCGTEYDDNNVCHIHVLLTSERDFMKFQNDGISITNIINFMKGIYVDFRICPMSDLDRLSSYINKGSKTDKIMEYYRNNYGFQ